MMNRLLIIATIIILLLLFIHPIDTDGDFYHHMNVGKYILTHHTLPRVDDLTFTAAGRPFVGNGWLSGVVFYELYSRYGAVPVNILYVALAVSTLGMAFWYVHRCLNVSLKRSVVSVLLAAPVMASRWPYRPEMFLYVFVFGLFFIEFYKNKTPWLSLLIPPLVLIETFFYSAGFPLVAGILVLLCMNTYINEKSIARHWLFYVSVAISFPFALLNGYGIGALLFIQQFPRWTTLWVDWVGLWALMMRPEIHYPLGIIIIYSVFTLLVVIFVVISRKSLKRHLMFSVLTVLVVAPYFTNRVRTFTGLLCVPFIAVVLAHTRSRVLLYGTGLIAFVLSAYFIVISPPGIGEDTFYFPPALIRFIRTNNFRGNVFNTPRIGAFLSYHLAPGVRVFSDTRDDLFVGTGVLEATQAFLSADASVSFLLHKYAADMVIVSSSDGTSFRDLIYDPGWALVYYKNPYLMFIPRSLARDSHIQVYDTADPYSPTGVKTAL
jgi:hypothetical protein